MSGRTIVILGMALLVVLPASVRGSVLAEIKDLDANEIRVQGFVLDRDGDITIDALAFGNRGSLESFGLNNAWILAADTRNVVWVLENGDSEKRPKHLRSYTDTIRLPKGRYEVYYSAHSYYGVRGKNIVIEDGGDAISVVMREVFGKAFDYKEYRKAVRDFRIVVEGEGEPLGEEEVIAYHSRLRENAVVSLTEIGDDYYEVRGLTLEKPMDLQIYAVGEVTKNGSYDYSWIVDTATYEKVWKLDHGNSLDAGGAEKNRVFKDAVSLPAGNYALFCVTDDSHAFDGWNSPPPYDPHFWGVTIQTADPEMARYVKTSSYEHIPQEDIVVEITRLGNSETRSEGFTLKARTRLRVYALGEGAESEMYDYSWIVDADTRKTVWEMTPAQTEHAGGASKNRVVDAIVELDKGNYIVYAVTDASHSYKDWNVSRPHDEERWGVTILIAGDPRANVAVYDETKDKSVLARIAMVGNDEHRSERFDLATGTAIRVYAIGEGQRGEMVDYAWIEDSRTGRVVWEMTYRMTEHAGGAKKNRVFDDTVRLEAGGYVVHYESDGSHSAEGWNAGPPSDPAGWGVTVKLTEEK